MSLDRITVIGLGLLGGSLARAAVERGLAREVVGVSRRPETAREALAAGWVDAAGTDPREGVRGASLVVLGTPLHAMEGVLSRAAGGLAEGAVVSDVGSVKGSLAERLPGLLPPGVEYVGAHPMAGSHERGLEHARADLFEGAPCVVTAAPTVSEASVARVVDFFRGLGARVVARDPAVHDAEVGWVSHLPHALAFAYAKSLTGAPAGAGDVRGSGYRDFTRIAWSDPELWADILSQNHKALAGPLQAVAVELQGLARLLERGDAEGLERFIAQAREALARLAEEAPSGGPNPETNPRKER